MPYTLLKQGVNERISTARYWFRVADVGAAGTGAWTDALAKVAP